MVPEFYLHPTLEYLAVVLWAISGVIVGQERGFDIVGVFAIALVSSTGGGILRDGVFLQRPLWIMSDPAALPTILAAVLLAVILMPLLKRQRRGIDKVVAMLDAVGVPAYAIVGFSLALAGGAALPAALFAGVITGVGGGIMRDLLVGEVPALFRPGQYSALISVVGLLLYTVLALPRLLDAGAAAAIAVGTSLILRLLVIRYNWRTIPADQVTITISRSLKQFRPRRRLPHERT
jgi:uncharacterized membrane protein YeiH